MGETPEIVLAGKFALLCGVSKVESFFDTLKRVVPENFGIITPKQMVSLMTTHRLQFHNWQQHQAHFLMEKFAVGETKMYGTTLYVKVMFMQNDRPDFQFLRASDNSRYSPIYTCKLEYLTGTFTVR